MNAGVTLSDAITALVAEKRAVGYKYHAEQQVLARFEAFNRNEFPGAETLTEASVQAWIVAARRRGVTPATLQSLAAPVREIPEEIHLPGTCRNIAVLLGFVNARRVRFVPCQVPSGSTIDQTPLIF
jgi:integrase/recombinase XerD